MRNAIGWSTNCWICSAHEITFFRFVGFYVSIKTCWNRIGRIKLTISSSFKLLLFTKSCNVFLDFTFKYRCWVSVTYYRLSNFYVHFSYGVFAVQDYKTGALVIRINLGQRFRSSRWRWGVSWFAKFKTASLSKVFLPVIICILFPLVRFWYSSVRWFLFLTCSFSFDNEWFFAI